MVKVVFLWASAHAPTEQQSQELQEGGQILFLKEVNSELFNQLTQMSLEADREELARQLLETGFDVMEVEIAACVIVQPAGDPAFHVALGGKMGEYLICPNVWFASSERVSIDTPQEDGTVLKTSVFQHRGWIKL